jgi:uncharacterized damage-inducible protein DinB
MSELLQVVPLSGYDPAIGRALWALEEVRRTTEQRVAGLSPEVLDWEGTERDEDSIGSLLYHIALVEVSWLYLDIREEPLPPEIREDFPHAMSRDGRLARLRGEGIDESVARLRRTRRRFLDVMRAMQPEDWVRARDPADTDYSVTPEWAVFHLVEHEAGHGAQIGSLRRRAALHVPRST